MHAQAEGLLLCIGAKLECINAVSRMGSAKRTAECGSSRRVVEAARTPPSSLAPLAADDAFAFSDTTSSVQAVHAAVVCAGRLDVS